MAILDQVEQPAAVASQTRFGRIGMVVERHPLLTVALVAVTIRVVTAVAVRVLSGGVLFNDDSTYSVMATSVVHGDAQRWDQYTSYLYNSTATFSVPLTILYEIFGPTQLVGQFLAGAFGAGAAVLTTKLGLEVLPRRWAVIGGLAVALLPAQVLFSSLTLKDSAVWAVASGLAVVVAVSARATGWKLLLTGVGAVVLLVAMAHLRIHTLVMLSWALAIAAWFPLGRERLARGLGAAAIALLVPWAFGAGPAGYTLARAAGSLENIRVANAAGAATAFIKPHTASPAEIARAQAKIKEIQARGGSAAEVDEAKRQLAAVSPDDVEDDELSASLRHLPRGTSVMLVEPFLWDVGSNSRVRLAAAELVVWYPLLALAAVGLLEVRRRTRALLFPALVLAGVTLLYGLAEGNFGTAYRHRGELVWPVALFAAVGAHRLWSRRSSASAPGG